MSDEIHATFWQHVDDLRAVLIRALLVILLGMAFAFYFHQEMIQFLVETLPGANLYVFSPAEGFIALFRLSFWLGVLGTSPFWISGILRYLMPALKNEEKSWLPLFFALSTVFIASGFCLCLFLTLPLASQYLYAFNQSIGPNMWGFSAYLDFVLMLIFSHGIAFEIGAVLFFLIHLGILTGEQLAKKRRHAIVASLMIGAILTPPDVLTQILVAGPLILFYELAIVYSYFTRT
jgi:sec-independent protein translocase protein TatC